ncbi:MAG: phenylacetate--CoA ligase [Clostridia bacterium]|nr:phenylacetate--CoA ligase [Clostridia bacterium]
MNYFDEKKETMPREELKRLQSERLIETVKKVYENVPTYRAKMDKINLKPEDIKSIDDIVKLPFTEKYDLRNNYPFGMFAVPQSKIVRLHASSGTTGKLTVVGYTKKDIEVWSECCARSLAMTGATNESTVHIAYGYGLFTGGLGMHYGSETLGATAVPVSSGNTARQLMLMKDFGADTLCCTPSYAIYLAEELEKGGENIADYKLKRGVFGAEPWSESMRNQIEHKLKIKAYNIYGLSEISGPGVACECEAQDGMHIFDDYFYPEIVDTDSLQPVSYGMEGELVFTTLAKEGIPLIRYRTRDITTLSLKPCACGRTSIKMGRVFGRSDDMLIIRGVNVFPSQIEAAMLTCEGIEPHYQIIVSRVDNLDTLELQVELSEKVFSDEVKKIEELRMKIQSAIQSGIGVSCKIKLVAPGTMPRSEGKAKRIVDNRNLRD